MSRTIVVTGARGGQCTSTVAAALALYAAAYDETALVSADRDATAALLGIPAHASEEPIAVIGRLTLVSPPAIASADTVIIDGGRLGRTGMLVGDSEHYVVLRGPCYVALATLLAAERPSLDGIILVAEDGRSLTERDVSEVTGVPVVATLTASPRVARTIDAGLLTSRLTRLRELAPLRLIVAPANPAPGRSRSPHRHSPEPPVTNTPQTYTDLPLSRSDNGGRVRAPQDSMSRFASPRHLSMVWDLIAERSNARHRQAEPRRRRLLHRRGRDVRRGLLHRPR